MDEKLALERIKEALHEDRLAIHCPHRFQAVELLELLSTLGFNWACGASLTVKDYYHIYGENTCYLLEFSPIFGHVSYFETNNYKVVSFDEFKEFLKEETKCLKKN